MNKCIKTMVISLLLILSMPMAKLSAQVSVWDGTWQPWTHGTGTEADPFLIENAQQLAYLAYRVNNGLDANGGHVSNHDYHYKLMVDVDLNGSEDFQWTPIGCSNSFYFGGHFEGNGHVISGLYINDSEDCVGFFGYTEGAHFSNLFINGTTVTTTGRYAGGVIGCTKGETYVMNCSNFVTISSRDCSGGILGVGYSGCVAIISNCYNTGNVTASTFSSSYSGGIMGYLANSGTASISNCYNSGIVTTSSTSISYSGGIIGYVGDSGCTISISNSYNTGNVTASAYNSNNSATYAYSGGIVGFLRHCITTISNNYNIGRVTGSAFSFKNSGGIIGAYDYATVYVVNCYFLSTCGGNNTYGGQSISAEAMQTQEFVEMLNAGLCAWEYDWNHINSGYPILTMTLVMTTTQNATNVSQSHATLHGTIESENTSVQFQGFEYKKTTDSNYQAIVVSGGGNISATLSDLRPNTQYHFRAFCTPFDCSTYYGEEKTFTTQQINVTTYPASNVTASSATLNGHIDAGDAEVSNKGFKYWPTNEPQDISTICVSTTGNISATINNLSQNTYQYRAFVESDGEIYQGGIQEFEVSWLNNDTILIYDADKLHWVAEQCNSGVTFEGKCVKLMNDIELPFNVPNNMISIGSYPNYPFKGTFDGNGKLITNLYIDQPNTPYQGFFGYTLNANLYNVGLVNITASGRNYTGGMVAYAKSTHMRDCYVNGGTLFALSYCGGLVGYQEQGTNSIISGCYNTCEVTGNNYVGGLIGFSNYSTVRNSYVAGRVSAQGEPVGAIIGGANEVLMYYCYFSTEITGQTEAIGWNNIGKDGGEGLTNAQMRDPQFVNTLNQGLVTPVWMADYTSHINNGFPIIKWQRPGTGVEEHDVVKSVVSLYPNPANNFVTIQSDEPSVSLQQVEVYDVTGRKVMSEPLDGQRQELGINILLSGVYHVRVQTSNGCYTNLKLVVQ